MTKNEFLKIILPVAELYQGGKLSDAAFEVYYRAVQDIPASVFSALVAMHVADPGQGMFFPMPAHVLAQAGTEADIAAQAGIEFDKFPTCDGTGSFDVRNESRATRQARRAAYVKCMAAKWRNADTLTRLATSPRLPEPLRLGIQRTEQIKLGAKS